MNLDPITNYPNREFPQKVHQMLRQYLQIGTAVSFHVALRVYHPSYPSVSFDPTGLYTRKEQSGEWSGDGLDS